jgi:exodeoxyribonuclease V gamma subunit
MIHLVYSNYTEELAEALAADLGERRQQVGVFEPLHLVVPTRHVEAYAKARVASLTGIAFHLRTHLSRELVSDLLKGQSVRLLDAAQLRGLVLTALLDGGRGGEDLEPVSDYIHGQNHREDAADLRKFQLATELALLFHEYGATRPDVIDAWRENRLIHAGPQASDERWQRSLWRRIFARGGLLDQKQKATGVRWLSLGELLDPRSPRSLRQVPLPPVLHFFGFSHGRPGYSRLLGALAERCEIRVYAHNPCEEFWEDISSPSRRGLPPNFTLEDPFGLDQEGETPALRLWGRPGRESMRLLNELSQCDFSGKFREPLDDGDSLLHRFQSDVLHRVPERTAPDPAATIEGDRSLRVLRCPGLRREIEVIAGEIWRLMDEDPDLRFHEIALVVSTREAERYLPQIGAVFGECGNIPFHVVDLAFSTESRVVEAVEMLLALPFGGFGRHDLLRLCTHPAVMARFPDDNPADWVNWSDRLGIVHGADRDDHRHTYITRDMFNWEQGVRRLALGAFMTGERSGDSRGLVVGRDLYLPEEHSQAGQLGAGRFSLLIRSLTADARFARQSRRPLAEWVQYMRLLVTSYLDAPTEHDEKELVRCLEALEKVDDGSAGEVELSYRLAFQLAMASLAELKSSRGQLMGEGVVVSSLHQLRSLPFKVSFLVGLGEGRFPEIERRNPLDLRGSQRQVGEVNLREQDKYAFLEQLLSTRKAFYLSYVSRDPFTGEDLQPSSVVLDLLDMLERGYLPRAEVAKLAELHPLRRHDPSLYPEVFQQPPAGRGWLPEAGREAQSLALGEHLRAHLGRGGVLDLGTLGRRNPEALARLHSHLRLVDAPAPRGELREGALPERVSASSVRRFLECPLQGHAQAALGLEDSEEDALAVEDEPFAMAPSHALIHLRGWMAEALVQGIDPASIYDQRIALLEHRGRAPTGLFATVERQAHRQILASWHERAQEALGRRRAQVVRFGAAAEHGFVEDAEPPILLDLDLGQGPVQVELTGVTSPLSPDRRASLFFLNRPADTGEEGEIRREKYLLRGFLDHLLLSAAATQAEARRAHVVYPASQTFSVQFAPIEPATARAYLAGLVVELLTRPHGYLLPCEVAVASRRRPDRSIAALVDWLGERRALSSLWGPIRRIDGYRPPPEAEARALLDRRYGLFFARLP